MHLLPMYYIRWHYSQALSDITGIIRNFLWFFYEFYSIPLLLETYFVPFHRLSETKPDTFDPRAWLEAIVITNLMRLVGIVVRTCLVVLGVLCLVVTMLVGMCMFAVWLLAPVLVVLLVVIGVTVLLFG